MTKHCWSSSAATSIRQDTLSQNLRGWWKVAKQLSKARLSAFVVSTAAVGYIAGKLLYLYMGTQYL